MWYWKQEKINNVKICRVIIIIFLIIFLFFLFCFVVVLIRWGTPSHFSIKSPDLSLPTTTKKNYQGNVATQLHRLFCCLVQNKMCIISPVNRCWPTRPCTEIFLPFCLHMSAMGSDKHVRMNAAYFSGRLGTPRSLCVDPQMSFSCCHHGRKTDEHLHFLQFPLPLSLAHCLLFGLRLASDDALISLSVCI